MTTKKIAPFYALSIKTIVFSEIIIITSYQIFSKTAENIKVKGGNRTRGNRKLYRQRSRASRSLYRHTILYFKCNAPIFQLQSITLVNCSKTPKLQIFFLGPFYNMTNQNFMDSTETVNFSKTERNFVRIFIFMNKNNTRSYSRTPKF